MKLFDIRSLMRDRKIRYGGYATVVTAVVVGVVIGANVLVGLIPADLDMTQRKLYSLSDQTFKVIENLLDDVVIYGFFQTGRENARLDEVIQKYTSRSRRISYKTIDPVRNPGFARQYEDEGSPVGENALVVESGSRYKPISQYDLYSWSYDQETMSQEVQAQQYELQLTSAIIYVTTDDLPTVGLLTLHDEEALPYELTKQLEVENYAIMDVNLVTSPSVPEEVDILLINAPQRDISAEELEKLRAFLQNGGRALVQIGLVREELKNMNELLSPYGIAVRNALETILLKGL